MLRIFLPTQLLWTKTHVLLHHFTNMDCYIIKLIYSMLELDLLLMWGFLSPKKDLQLKILTTKNLVQMS